jgi:hypothetical protein
MVKSGVKLSFLLCLTLFAYCNYWNFHVDMDNLLINAIKINVTSICVASSERCEKITGAT